MQEHEQSEETEGEAAPNIITLAKVRELAQRLWTRELWVRERRMRMGTLDGMCMWGRRVVFWGGFCYYFHFEWGGDDG